MSKGLNAAVVNSLSSSSPSEHDQLVWDETLMEVEKGWLAPSKADSECFVAKRFPVVQKDKVRMIDDFSVCGVNGAYGLREKLRVQAVDELCSYLAYMLDTVGEASFQLDKLYRAPPRTFFTLALRISAFLRSVKVGLIKLKPKQTNIKWEAILLMCTTL